MTTILIVIAAFIAINFGRIYYQNNQTPELGVKNGQFTPLSSKPNNVSTQAETEDKKVAPLPVKASTSATMEALKQAVSEYGKAEIEEESDTYLYVIFTTDLMKYRDDVEFWIDEANGVVHFRSASRAGYSDMGLNRKRYEALAALYAEK
ncbi:DUF1499 domain-containing protein [Vibrio sp. RC27]